jgi:tetratricopeptide (TPR) repeat protein
MTDWLALAPKPRPLSGTDKYTVFLSYRSADRLWVLNLYDVLRVHGHMVFIDQVELTAGDRLTKRLEDALTTSQAGVLVWSASSSDSDWVRREYETMEKQASKKPAFRFVPVRLDNAELPAFADNRIFLDFNAYPDGPNGGELLRLLHAVVGLSLSPEAAHFAAEQDDASQRAANQIGAAVKNGRPERLVDLFAQDGLPWQTSAMLGCKAAEGLTKLGAHDQAMAMLTALETRFPKAVRPRQLHALVLSRRARNNGPEADLAAAQDILGELYEAGERDPETLGIYGATWMERYARSGRLPDLKRSRDLYAEAFAAAKDDYYTGINAAAKSVLIGTAEDLARAADLAGQVQQIVGTDPAPNDYWKTATVGEVFLMQKQYADAARLYDAAVAMAPAETESHKTTWLQACRLMAKLEPAPAERALVRQVFQHLPDCAPPPNP